MRLRFAKLFVILIIIINLILIYYSRKSILWKNIITSLSTTNDEIYNNDIHYENEDKHKTSNIIKEKTRNVYKHLRKSITIVFRNFYTFENDIKYSIDSILDVVPNMPIIVYEDGPSYPPITYERNLSSTMEKFDVRFFNLDFDLTKTSDDLNPLSVIRTKYVLFMPDSIRLNNKNLLQKILKEININNELKTNNIDNKISDSKISILKKDEIIRKILIIPFADNLKSFASCTEINLDLPTWTIQYVAVNSSSNRCEMYLQKHAFLVDIGVLKLMADPLATPFPEMFYLQAKFNNITKVVLSHKFQDGRRLFVAYHTKQRRLELRRRQFRDMYKKLQIKRIVRRSHKAHTIKTIIKDGNNPQNNLVLDPQFSSVNFSMPLITEIDLIGCERTTKSCIGTVYNQKPFYIYLGKHTPPCCLDKLKSTFNHVLEEFENVGIRYWLDNFALKFAIETNHLSPDAYDIDISFNVNDLERSNSLKKSQNRPFVDNDGFYWFKATDGNYFHVQFSKINQIAVNLLPFEINGNEVRAKGFFGWKAITFSVEFLHPMSTILFLNKNVMCPNNVREYLEYKNIH